MVLQLWGRLPKEFETTRSKRTEMAARCGSAPYIGANCTIAVVWQVWRRRLMGRWRRPPGGIAGRSCLQHKTLLQVLGADRLSVLRQYGRYDATPFSCLHMSVGLGYCEARPRRAPATANSTFAKAICGLRARPGREVRGRLLSLAQTSASVLVDGGAAHATTAAAEGYPSEPAGAFQARARLRVPV